jgi:hypothetical protein
MFRVSAFQRREAFLVLRLEAAILMLRPSSGDQTSSERGLMPDVWIAFTPAPECPPCAFQQTIKIRGCLQEIQLV